MKTDGQLNYEAFVANLKTGHWPWEELPPHTQASWEVAARAVLQANQVIKPGL